MDYEKLYKESIKRAKKVLKGEATDRVPGTCIPEYIFPELKESEDELTWLTKFIEEEIDSLSMDIRDNEDSIKLKNLQKSLTWLEKQGEQKSTDKVEPTPIFRVGDTLKRKGKDYTFIVDRIQGGYYHCDHSNGAFFPIGEQDNWELVEQKPTESKPKFKAGDWVVRGTVKAQIIGIEDNKYCFSGYKVRISNIDKHYHLWTIQDANDGDILSGKIDGDYYILIFKTIKDGWIETYGHYYNSVNRFCAPSQLFCRDHQGKLTPATKEQCDLLFQKMREAGYEYDVEKKELKKIHIIDEGKAEMDYCFTKMMAGENVRPAWSDEDENYLQSAENACEYQYGKNTSTILWLKSLKDRVQPKPKEWNDEDEKIRNILIRICINALPDIFKRYGYEGDKKNIIAWLEKQTV